MSAFTPDILSSNRPVVRVPELQSRYLIVADKLSSSVAQQIHSGEGLSDDLLYGYGLGTRITRRVSRYNALSHSESVFNLPEIDGESPWITVISTDPTYALSRVEFDQEFEPTEGERIRKLRYHIDPGTEQGLVKAAVIDVYTSGIPGEVEGAEEVDGSMMGVVTFPTIEAARRFNTPEFTGRPAWLGENVTEKFSTRKLVEDLSYGAWESEAYTVLQQSANKRDTHLRRRAIGLRLVPNN